MRVPSRNFTTITSALALAGLMTVLAGFGRTTLCFNAAGCPGCEASWASASIATALANIEAVKSVDRATVTIFCLSVFKCCLLVVIRCRSLTNGAEANAFGLPYPTARVNIIQESTRHKGGPI